jgi:hypothetical protein
MMGAGDRRASLVVLPGRRGAAESPFREARLGMRWKRVDGVLLCGWSLGA